MSRTPSVTQQPSIHYSTFNDQEDESKYYPITESGKEIAKALGILTSDSSSFASSNISTTSATQPIKKPPSSQQEPSSPDPLPLTASPLPTSDSGKVAKVRSVRTTRTARAAPTQESASSYQASAREEEDEGKYLPITASGKELRRALGIS